MTCLGGELVEWDLGSFLRVSLPPPPPFTAIKLFKYSLSSPSWGKGLNADHRVLPPPSMRSESEGS
jgi:hypothetical protein